MSKPTIYVDLFSTKTISVKECPLSGEKPYQINFNKALQHRSASLHWTAFKSRLCGFAAQKYSTKPQLKSCR